MRKGVLIFYDKKEKKNIESDSRGTYRPVAES